MENGKVVMIIPVEYWEDNKDDLIEIVSHKDVLVKFVSVEEFEEVVKIVHS